MAGIPTAPDGFPMILDKPMKVMVARPKKKARNDEEKGEVEEEVLVIEGIEVKRDEFVKFDVFINDEDDVAAGGGGAEKTEFAGSFVNVPHKHRHGGRGGSSRGGGVGDEKKVIKTKLRLGISELLEDLGVEEDDEHVLVSLVPRCDNVVVTISGIKIELE